MLDINICPIHLPFYTSMRKSIFVSFIIVIIGFGVGAWLFFSTAILEFTDDMGITHTQPKKEAITTSSGIITENTGSSWNPDQVRTETMESSGGVTVTVSTN